MYPVSFLSIFLGIPIAHWNFYLLLDIDMMYVQVLQKDGFSLMARDFDESLGWQSAGRIPLQKNHCGGKSMTSTKIDDFHCWTSFSRFARLMAL